MRYDPTDAEISQWVSDLRDKVRSGWTPPLQTRLELGLTQELIGAWRSTPEEADMMGSTEPEDAP